MAKNWTNKQVKEVRATRKKCFECGNLVLKLKGHGMCQNCYNHNMAKFQKAKQQGNVSGTFANYIRGKQGLTTSVLDKIEVKPKKGHKQNASKNPYDWTLKKLKAKLKEVLHEYVRLLHADKNLYCTCYTCGARKPYKGTGQMHTGHYMTDGNNPATRYDLDNLRPQCLRCNYYGSGKQSLYREHLVKEIGEERVLALEKKAKTNHKWDTFQLAALYVKYKKLLADLEKQKL